MTPDLRYYWEGGRARVVRGQEMRWEKKKKKCRSIIAIYEAAAAHACLKG